MTHNRLVVWFVAVLACSLYSRWDVYHAGAGRCSLDGNRLTPIYRVDLMLGGRIETSFCCIRCAREWPDVPPGAYWQLRDEATGRILDATRGCFVESSVVTIPSRQDRTHVFSDWVDARNHMADYDGYRVANPLPDPPPSVPVQVMDEDALSNAPEEDEDHD